MNLMLEDELKFKQAGEKVGFTVDQLEFMWQYLAKESRKEN